MLIIEDNSSNSLRRNAVAAGAFYDRFFFVKDVTAPVVSKGVPLGAAIPAVPSVELMPLGHLQELTDLITVGV